MRPLQAIVGTRVAILGAALALVAAAPAVADDDVLPLAAVNGFVAAPAIGADGRAAVAVTDFAAERSRVLVHSRSPAGRWSAPRVVRVSQHELFEPVAAFAGDDLLVGWLRARRIDRDQVLETRRGGGPVEVVSTPGERAILPAIAGPSLVGWLDGDSRLRLGAETLSGRRELAYSLAQLRDGTAVAVSQSLGAGGVRVRTRPPGGGWGAPLTLSGPRTAREAALATGQDGTIAVAWAQNTDRGYRVHLSIRPPGGGFSPARALAEGDGDARAPSLAVRPDGGVIVAWLGRADVRTAVVERDGAVSVARRVSAADRRIAAVPQVFADAEGDALITWQESRRLMAVTRAAGGRLSAPHALSGPRIFAPRVVANARGQALAAWSVEHRGGARIQVAETTF